MKLEQEDFLMNFRFFVYITLQTFLTYDFIHPFIVVVQLYITNRFGVFTSIAHKLSVIFLAKKIITTKIILSTAYVGKRLLRNFFRLYPEFNLRQFHS